MLVTCALVAQLNAPFAITLNQNAQRIVETAVSKQVESNSTPAIYCAVSWQGRIVAQFCKGRKRLSSSEQVSLSDRLMIGSISKSVTAVVASTFIQEGSLKWTTSVGEYLPEIAAKFPTHKSLTANVLQLIQHNSGLPRGNDHEFAGKPPQEWRQHFVETMFTKAPVGNPGEKTEYSAGQTVLGRMLEVHHKTSFEELCKNRLFVPLQLSSFGWGKPWEQYPNQPKGIAFLNDKEIEPLDGWNLYIKNDPSGGMHCTITDLCRYATVFAVGDSIGVPALSKSTVSALNRNLGGNPRSWGGATGLGDYSQCYVDPQAQLAIAIVVLKDAGRGGTDKVNAIQSDIISVFKKGR